MREGEREGEESVERVEKGEAVTALNCCEGGLETCVVVLEKRTACKMQGWEDKHLCSTPKSKLTSQSFPKKMGSL
jgi:hypothetical protein